MTDPTVTAVSELSDDDLRGDVIKDPRSRFDRNHNAIIEELLRARSALADVGETCKSCGGLGGHSVVGNHGDRYMSSCEACQGTGKQPLPAAEEGPSLQERAMNYARNTHAPASAATITVARDSFIDGYVTSAYSPAAHTAQVTEEEREAIDKAVELFTRAARSSPLEWEDMHRRIATLRRLASTADRE